MKYSLITIIAILLMSSCSGTKDLSRARVEMPASYMSGDTVPQSADSLTLADVKWWEFYSDTTLTKILRTALDNNRDILKAAAKVEQMRALYGVAKADMLPQIGLNVAYSYETNKYNGGSTDTDPEHDLKLPISWEVNLWGAMFHAKNAGKARFIASLEDYRAMRMTLIAEVATAYFRLLSLENELAIVRQTLKTREEALKLAKIRFEGGLTSETVYQQAMVEYSSAASLIPALELRVTSMRNSLTTLLGEFPRDVFENRDVLFDTDFADRLPAGIP
ncbi:MAG: TolC family protein, partial [Muribaculaceae bacterium]|nr:TolC family protein [Muribaculaceae bacterium]